MIDIPVGFLVEYYRVDEVKTKITVQKGEYRYSFVYDNIIYSDTFLNLVKANDVRITSDCYDFCSVYNENYITEKVHHGVKLIQGYLGEREGDKQQEIKAQQKVGSCIISREDLHDFLRHNTSVHCPTKEISDAFLNLVKANDVRITSDCYDFFSVYGDKTCYNLQGNILKYSSYDWYMERKFRIISLGTPAQSEDQPILEGLSPDIVVCDELCTLNPAEDQPIPERLPPDVGVPADKYWVSGNSGDSNANFWMGIDTCKEEKTQAENEVSTIFENYKKWVEEGRT